MPKDPMPIDDLMGSRYQQSPPPPARPVGPVSALGDFGPRPPAAAPPPRPPWRNPIVVTVAFLLVAALVAVVVLVGPGGLGGKAPVTPVAAPAPTAAAVTAAPTPSATVAAALDPTVAKIEIHKKLVSAGAPPQLPWPTSGQAEVVVDGVGSLGHSGSGQAVPIASVAKVMTAYTILRDHPLGSGRPGPTITVSAAEAAAYPAQQAAGLSVVMVAAGEKISLQDAMKGLLIASGDNMAEILARWDAGSVPAFVARMNSNARRLGMSHTHYVDPTGLDPGTVSTTSDLLKLAPRAMAMSTFAELVGSSSGSIPLNPVLHNPNSLLGVHGVFGIKTGTTTAAGGCLLFAARRLIEGKPYVIYGAVLGIDGDRSAIHSNARDAADALVVRAGDSLHKIILVHDSDVVATMVDKHGEQVQIGVRKGVSVVGWSGQKFTFRMPEQPAGTLPTKLIITTPKGKKTVKLVKLAYVAPAPT